MTVVAESQLVMKLTRQLLVLVLLNILDAQSFFEITAGFMPMRLEIITLTKYAKMYNVTLQRQELRIDSQTTVLECWMR